MNLEKIKKIFVKNKGKFSVIIIFSFALIITIVVYYVSRDVRFLPIYEISCLIEYNKTLAENQLEANKINTILDQKFQALCKNAKTIDFEFQGCDFDTFTHYIEAKVNLGKKSELLENKEVLFLLNKTYVEHKADFVNKTSLVPNDNRWNHILMAMNSLDMLDSEEKNFWIAQYSHFKLSEGEPKLPQVWNRIWMLRLLDVDNVNDLAGFSSSNFSEINQTVCGYIPKIVDLKNENVFGEGETAMFSKYLVIKEFCNATIDQGDKNTLLKIKSMEFDSPCEKLYGEYL